MPPPFAPPRPYPPASRPHATAPSRPPAWGWLEWMILGQIFIPALLFVPGLSSIRIVTRVGAYAITLVAWVAIAMARRRGVASFPARPWLTFCAGYLLLSILHPTTNSLLAGLAEAILGITILSPAFWAGEALASHRQIPRIMAILFLGNALGALVGIGQVYRPNIFNPPRIMALETNEMASESLTWLDAHGNKILRPCGLSDSPGAASAAGEMAAVLGLAWALVPMAAWKRLACLGLAAAGTAAIFFTQVRTMVIVAGICIVALLAILIVQRNLGRALLLGGCGAAILTASMAWAIAKGGSAIGDRLGSLAVTNAGSAAELYKSNRGGFVWVALTRDLPDYPLGAGLGRWGMIHQYFGDHNASADRAPLWAEVQITAWVYDGGAPLLIAYFGAALAAVADSLRIALTSKDRALAYWAGVVAATNVGILAMCFTYPVFVSPIGVQFWLLSAALHAADRRARGDASAADRPRGPRPMPRPTPPPPPPPRRPAPAG